MFENEPDSVLIPSQPFRALVFGEYLAQGRGRKFFKGEHFGTVCRKGDDPYLFYIESGSVEAVYLHDDGTSFPLYRRKVGNAFQCEFAGIASLGPSRLSFVALENSIVTSFTYNQLYELVKADPRVFEDLIYVTHMSFGQFGHRLDNTGNQSSSRRIIVWLKKLMDVNEPAGDGTYRIACDMTVQDISDLLMIHVTTCSRLLGALKARGIADRTRTHILIRDPAALEKLADEENPILY